MQQYLGLKKQYTRLRFCSFAWAIFTNSFTTTPLSPPKFSRSPLLRGIRRRNRLVLHVRGVPYYVAENYIARIDSRPAAKSPFPSKWKFPAPARNSFAAK